MKFRRLSSYPKNVPRALIRVYRLNGENGKKTAKELSIHDAHLSKLLRHGVEPKDNEIRKKMFLKPLKPPRAKRRTDQRKEVPEFIKRWRHLPTEERQNVIQAYLRYKDNASR